MKDLLKTTSRKRALPSEKFISRLLKMTRRIETFDSILRMWIYYFWRPSAYLFGISTKSLQLEPRLSSAISQMASLHEKTQLIRGLILNTLKMPNFKLKQFCKNRNSKNKCLTLIFRRFIHQVIAMERKKDKFSSVEHFNFMKSQAQKYKSAPLRKPESTHWRNKSK